MLADRGTLGDLCLSGKLQVGASSSYGWRPACAHRRGVLTREKRPRLPFCDRLHAVELGWAPNRFDDAVPSEGSVRRNRHDRWEAIWSVIHFPSSGTKCSESAARGWISAPGYIIERGTPGRCAGFSSDEAIISVMVHGRRRFEPSRRRANPPGSARPSVS
jgi:hypothetical protein